MTVPASDPGGARTVVYGATAPGVIEVAVAVGSHEQILRPTAHRVFVGVLDGDVRSDDLDIEVRTARGVTHKVDTSLGD